MLSPPLLPSLLTTPAPLCLPILSLLPTSVPICPLPQGWWARATATLGQQYWEWSVLQLLLSILLNGLLLAFVAYDGRGAAVLGARRFYNWPLEGLLPPAAATGGDQEEEAAAAEGGARVRGPAWCLTLPALHALTAALVLASFGVSTGQRHVASGLKRNPRGVLRLAYSAARARTAAFMASKLLPPRWVGKAVLLTLESATSSPQWPKEVNVSLCLAPR